MWDGTTSQGQISDAEEVFELSHVLREGRANPRQPLRRHRTGTRGGAAHLPPDAEATTQSCSAPVSGKTVAARMELACSSRRGFTDESSSGGWV